MKWQQVFDIVRYSDGFHRVHWKNQSSNAFPGIRWEHAERAIQVAEAKIKEMEEAAEKELVSGL